MRSSLAFPLVTAGRSCGIETAGFFISADGYAVTNNHVIEGNTTAEIQTDDQKTYTAKVVGTDPISDLALLKVDGRWQVISKSFHTVTKDK